jgi:hypothetical protein
MSQLANNIEVQNLNHLGIIAGIIDEIGIVEIINEQYSLKSKYFVALRVPFPGCRAREKSAFGPILVTNYKLKCVMETLSLDPFS